MFLLPFCKDSVYGPKTDLLAPEMTDLVPLRISPQGLLLICAVSDFSLEGMRILSKKVSLTSYQKRQQILGSVVDR